MTPYTAEGILALITKLCAIPSISGHAEQENACAKLIYEELKSIPCSGGNMLDVKFIDCEGDALKRKAVYALLTPPQAAERSVLLTGHFDVVDTSCYGELQPIACDLPLLTEKLKELGGLERTAQADLESGNWLFGRGSMDMKAGLALFIAAIGKYAAQENLAVNIAFLAVPDEEANSAGMRGAMREFCTLLEERSIKLNAALTGEPCFWTKAAGQTPASRPYYTGSTGKIMPAFLAVGQGAHIENYFAGLSSALMIANVVRAVEASAALQERTVDGVLLSPAACLSMQVRRDSYSVTLPERSAAYFNVLCVERTPLEILQICRKAATSAALETLAAVSRAARAYGKSVTLPSIDVFTVSELVQMRAAQAKITKPDVMLELVQFARSVPGELDAREISLRTLEHLASSVRLINPAIIVGFVPPYYPALYNRNRTEDEKRLRGIIMETVQEAAELAGDGATSYTEVFMGISDLSFLGFQGEEAALLALKDNMPGWGVAYDLPIEQLLTLDVPVANMGPAGRDAHKDTERLELRYSLEVAPKLLLNAIDKIARN